MQNFIKKLLGCQSGVTAIEYGLIAALIAVVTITGVTVVGTSLNTKYDTISTKVTAAGGP